MDWQALEADAVRATGMSFDESGGALSWSALYALSMRPLHGSSLYSSKNPEVSAWSSDVGRASMLADIYDALAFFRHEWLTAHRREGVVLSEPGRYPRPHDKRREEEIRRVADMRLSEFDEIMNGGCADG